MKAAFFASAVVLILAGCGADGVDPSSSPGHTAVTDTVLITVADTIGVLMGDTLLEFGNITDASMTPRGNLFILDGLKARLGIYSPEGDFIRFVGRYGSGPGEYQYPKSFALMDDGSMVVSDWGAIATTFLDAELEFDTLLAGYPAIAPDRIVPCPGGSYVGMSLEYSLENGEPAGETFLARFGRSMAPRHIYAGFPMRFTVDEDGDLNVHTVGMAWDTARDGSVCLAQTCDSIWAFTLFDPSGEELFTMEKEWEKVPKTEEELAEGVYHESLSTSEESGNSMNRNREYENQPRYWNAISSINIDDSNRIWVGQGWTDHPVFEVYDFQGELLFVAEIRELNGTSGFSYCFHNGFIAFDTAPEDYPKVYLLAGEVLVPFPGNEL